MHSFFTQPGAAVGSFADESSPKTIVHYHHLDPLASSPPETPVEVVLYDLDGTLITPRGSNKFPKGSDDWKWWNDAVPRRLKEDAKAGRHIVILSNQAFKAPKVRREWREKLPLIAAKVGVRRVLIAAGRRADPRARSAGKGRVSETAYGHV